MATLSGPGSSGRTRWRRRGGGPSAGLNVGAGRFSPPGDTRAGEVAGASRLRARFHQVVDVGPAVAPHGRRPQPQTPVSLWRHCQHVPQVLSLIHISEPTRLLSISYAV